MAKAAVRWALTLDSCSTVTDDCTFARNDAVCGAAIAITDAGAPVVTSCTLVLNGSTAGRTMAAGLALRNDSEAQVTQTIIAFSQEGAAVQVQPGSAILLTSTTTATIASMRIRASAAFTRRTTISAQIRIASPRTTPPGSPSAGTVRAATHAGPRSKSGPGARSRLATADALYSAQARPLSTRPCCAAQCRR